MTTPTKPKCFIASPLFNGPQHEIIGKLESLLEAAGYEYYSARKHSGSDKMTAEDRKDLKKWDPVFDSNEKGLDECRVCIAVLEYALPSPEHEIGLLVTHGENDRGSGRYYAENGTNKVKKFTSIELPDAGTVWEMGYLRAQGKIVLGFHQDKAKHLNLMLSNSVDGMLKGFDAVESFLSGSDAGASFQPSSRLIGHQTKVMRDNGPDKAAQFLLDASLFNWSKVDQFDAEKNEVE